MDVTRLPALVAGTANIGDVDVLTVPAPLSTTGTGTEATALRVTVATDSTGVLSVDDNGGNLSVDWAGTAPPIGAGLEATALRVTVATDSTGVLSVDDNAGSLTVDVGTALPAGANNIGDVDVLTIAAGDNNIGNVDIVTMPNVTLAAGTNTNEVVGDVAHDAPIAGNPLTIGGVASAAAPTAVTLDQDAVRAWFLLNGAQATVLTAAGALIGGDATNGLDVDVTRLPALVAGTANIGDVDVLTLPALVAGTANIGDVDVLTIAAGDNNIGNVDVVTLPNVTLAAGTNTNEIVGDVAHDAGVAGNPVLVCGAAQNVDDTAPPNRISTESDATRLATDFDGAVFAHPHGPQVWSYHSNGSAALTDAAVHAAPGVGLSLYVTDIVCSTGAATAMNIFFEESTTTVLGPWYLEAVAGRGLALHFQTPKKITANTALTVTTSAAIAQSVDVTGFTAQG